VGLALAAVTALAAATGALLGLPAPKIETGGGGVAASIAGESTLGAGGSTAFSLAKGPFHPIAGKFELGEADAKFGADRGGRRHEGQDLFAKPGTPLVAVRDAVVVDKGRIYGRFAGGRGNYVVLYSSAQDRSYVYMHMLKPSPLRMGQRIEAGAQVGQVGCTGSCWGPHLHFELRRGRAALRARTKPLDPLPLLRRWPPAPTP